MVNVIYENEATIEEDDLGLGRIRYVKEFGFY